VGASTDNYATLPTIGTAAAALKMYLNETFTTLKLDDVSVWMKVGLMLRQCPVNAEMIQLQSSGYP